MDYYYLRYKDCLDLIVRIWDYYGRVIVQMGYEVILMEGYLNLFVFGIVFLGREDLVIVLFEYNIELYFDKFQVWNNFGYYYLFRGNKEGVLKVFKDFIKLNVDELILVIIESLEKEVGGK